MKKLVSLLVLCIILSGGFALAEAAEYSISFPENIGYIFDRSSAGFTVKSDSGSVQYITVRCTADNETVIDEALTSNGQFFSLSELDYGKHNILIEIFAGDMAEYSLTQEITVINKHQPQLYDALSRVGVVQHRGQGSVQDTERLELMNTAGVKWARDLLSWWSYETEKDVWNDSYGDKVCKVYNENGTKLHLTLCHYNNLYNKEGEKGYAPYTEKQLERFAEYVRRVVTSYPDIKEFEIYNEPNRDATWSPEADVVAYCNLVKCASRVIRQLRPDARIIAGAVSNTRDTTSSGVKGSSKGDGIRFLREMGQLGIFAYVDAISAHPYTYTNYSDKRYSDFLGLYEDVRDYGGWYGWKDFQITETGFPIMSQYNITEDIAAENIIKSFVYGDRVGAEKVFIYEFVASGTDSSNREHQFGILNHDRSARLAYPALVQYCNTISGADYLGEIKLGNSTAYLYQKEGDVIGVVWSAAEDKVTFAQEMAVNCFDLYGNELAAESNTILVGTAPVYVTGVDKSYAVQAVGAVAAELYKQADEIAGTELTVPDLSHNISAAVENNYSIALNTELDESDRMLFYSYIHRAGAAMAALYPIFDEGSSVQLSGNMTAAVRAKIENKAGSAELPFADAILRQAEKYYSFAEELDEFSQSNAKNAAVYAKYMLALNLCRLAEHCAEWENADYQNSLVFSVTPTKVKTAGRHTAGGSITNVIDKALDFDLSVYDNENNRVSSAVSIKLDAGETADIDIDFDVADNLPGGHYFYELRAEKDGQTLSSQSILIDIEALGPIDAVTPSVMREFSDGDFCFEVGGKSFLVLDNNGSGRAKYFVMALDGYGTRAFSTDNTQRFNPDNSGSIASYVNSIAFPQEIAAYMDKNHIWRTEAGYLGGDIPNDYDVTCAVSILSYTELALYADKIGWNDLGRKWWLRTVRGANSWWDKGLIVNWDRQRVGEQDIDATAAVRPVFYLGEDFFDCVRLESMGEKVKDYLNPEILMANGVYTDAELAAMGMTSDIFDTLRVDLSDDALHVSYTLKEQAGAVVYAAVYDENRLSAVYLLEGNDTVYKTQGQSVKIIVTAADGVTPLCMPIMY